MNYLRLEWVSGGKRRWVRREGRGRKTKAQRTIETGSVFSYPDDASVILVSESFSQFDCHSVSKCGKGYL